jgi:hypothetical protein
MRLLLAAFAGLILVAASEPAGLPRTAEAQARLDKWLGGRVPGEAQICLQSNKTNSPVGIDDRTLLFRDGPRIWRSELKGGNNCGDFGPRRALMAENHTMRLCSGDTVYIIDMNDGSGVGACMLGDFVPYTKAKD